MTPEEFQRIKEEEKVHLRKLKELKERLRGLQRQQKVARALTDMQQEENLATHDEMVEKLAMDTLRSEARLEAALDASPPVDEEALLKLRAQDLIQQLQQEMAQPDTTPEKESDSGPSESESTPEKTIGRRKTTGASPKQHE